jgi:hypothetical protein
MFILVSAAKIHFEEQEQSKVGRLASQLGLPALFCNNY